MDLLIIGTGYVGLVTGTCFADLGHHVTCLDIDEKKINLLKNLKSPLYEPQLESLIIQNVEEKRLSFSTSYSETLENADVCFICVSTPSKDNGEANLEYILQAAEDIANHMKGYLLIVVKSTVPPGTTDLVKEHIQKTLEKLNKSFSFDVISNPEFLREGCAVHDFMNPDRIIIGTDKHANVETMKALYAPLKLEQKQFITMDIASSEMTKYAANAMLACRISFMNELAGLCEKLGANIEHVREGIGSDTRIGNQFLQAGVGFGGSCFPKDIRALKACSEKLDYDMPILTAVEAINEKQKRLLAQKISLYFSSKGGIKGKTIAIWGISFKPETDDIREAPSIELIQELINLGARLQLYDPVAMQKAQTIFQNEQNLKWCQNEYEASLGADAIALVTEWNQFKITDLEVILEKMHGKALFDGRNQYLDQDMNNKGFEYFAIGAPSK